MALAPIPWKLVEECCPDQDPERLEKTRDDQLLDLHLLQRKGKGVYQLHQLIREFLRLKARHLPNSAALSKRIVTAIVLRAQSVPQMPTLEQCARVAESIPHLKNLVQSLVEFLDDESLVWPFVAIGRFYAGQSLFNEAVQWLGECVSLAEQRCGQDHTKVATGLNNLALLLQGTTRLAEAEPLTRRALAIDEKSYGQDHPNVARGLNNLALLLQETSRLAEAEPLMLRALAISEKKKTPGLRQQGFNS